MTPQQLSERLWQFAARIANVVDALPESRVGRHVASQIGTQITDDKFSMTNSQLQGPRF